MSKINRRQSKQTLFEVAMLDRQSVCATFNVQALLKCVNISMIKCKQQVEHLSDQVNNGTTVTKTSILSSILNIFGGENEIKLHFEISCNFIPRRAKENVND